MLGLIDKYPATQTACENSQYVQPTIQEQLKQRKLQLTSQLDEVNKAMAVLEANPGFVEAFNARRKLV